MVYFTIIQSELLLVYQQSVPEQDSSKDIKSGAHTEEADFDNSVEPNLVSKRVTMVSIKEGTTKSIKSAKELKPLMSEENFKLYGTMRSPTTLSSSLKIREHSPQGVKTNKPIFLTSFKIPDNATLRTEVAKLEPILDPYNPPKLHNFRTDAPPEDKPPFMVNKY